MTQLWRCIPNATLTCPKRATRASVQKVAIQGSLSPGALPTSPREKERSTLASGQLVMGRQWCLRHRRQNRHGKLVRCVAHDVHLLVRMLVVCTTGFYHQEKEDQDLGLRTGGKACIVLGVFDRLGEEVAGAIAPPNWQQTLRQDARDVSPGGTVERHSDGRVLGEVPGVGASSSEHS